LKSSTFDCIRCTTKTKLGMPDGEEEGARNGGPEGARTIEMAMYRARSKDMMELVRTSGHVFTSAIVCLAVAFLAALCLAWCIAQCKKRWRNGGKRKPTFLRQMVDRQMVDRQSQFPATNVHEPTPVLAKACKTD